MAPQLQIMLLTLKQEMAKMLGFSNYAELSLAKKMAPSVEAVTELTDLMAKKAIPAARKELEEVTALARKEGGDDYAEDVLEKLEPWDTTFWVVAPTPDKQYKITLAYNKEPISITNTTQPSTAPAATNGTYLSNKYQDLLLYGCLVNAFGYLKGPQDMIQYYNQAYEKALMSYAIEQQGRRRRDEYSDGVIRTVLDSKNPSINK